LRGLPSTFRAPQTHADWARANLDIEEHRSRSFVSILGQGSPWSPKALFGPRTKHGEGRRQNDRYTEVVRSAMSANVICPSNDAG